MSVVFRLLDEITSPFLHRMNQPFGCFIIDPPYSAGRLIFTQIEAVKEINTLFECGIITREEQMQLYKDVPHLGMALDFTEFISSIFLKICPSIFEWAEYEFILCSDASVEERNRCCYPAHIPHGKIYYKRKLLVSRTIIHLQGGFNVIKNLVDVQGILPEIGLTLLWLMKSSHLPIDSNEFFGRQENQTEIENTLVVQKKPQRISLWQRLVGFYDGFFISDSLFNTNM